CGICVLQASSRSAIILRIPESGMRREASTGAGGAIGETGAFAASKSRAMIRPPGPEPLTIERSNPLAVAIFLARGDALILVPETGALSIGSFGGAILAGAAILVF